MTGVVHGSRGKGSQYEQANVSFGDQADVFPGDSVPFRELGDRQTSPALTGLHRCLDNALCELNGARGLLIKTRSAVHKGFL